MGKFFCSMGIIAGLGFPPVSGHALQVVEWGERGPIRGVSAASPPVSGAGRGGVVEIALQHGGGFPEWDRLGAPWGEPAQSPATLAALAPGLPAASEGERGSPLLAGLGAIVLLMWRRLRRH